MKAADLVKENRQINQQLSVFTNDIFSIYEFSQKKAMRAGKYIVGRSWINKQQHCIQHEIKKLKLHHNYPTDLKVPADLMFIIYPK